LKGVSKRALPLGYLLLSACGGGGGGSSTSDPNLVSKDLPFRIPSRNIIPDEVLRLTDLPFTPLKPGGEVVPEGDIDPDASEQLAWFKDRPLAWGPCNEAMLPGQERKTLDLYQGVLGASAFVQCAAVPVPKNYEAPYRDGIALLRLLKVSIGAQSNKRHLLFNPGGPGAPGLLSPFSFVYATKVLADGGKDGEKSPDPTMVALAKKMLAKYDFIGFAPRGSHELLPVNVARGRRYLWSWGASIDREEERLEHNARAYGAAFATNKMAPFVHSDAVARDMDVIRHVVGDEKLHYYGISYGTKFGLWHAGLFPATTGRMLLEAVVDYGTDPEVVALEKRGPWLRNFLSQLPSLYSRIDGHKFFPKDRGDIDITKILGNLDPSLQYLVMDQLQYGAFKAVSDEKIYDYLITVLLAAKYFQENESIDQTFSEDEEIDRLIKAIMARYRNLSAQKQEIALETRLSGEGLFAFWCNDAQQRRSPEALRDVLRRAAGGFYLADIEALDTPCAFWPFEHKRRVKPTLASMHDSGVDKNILMLNAEWDRATTLAGAERTRNALPNARFIRLLESTKHNFFPTKSTVVDSAVYKHFVDDVLPDNDIEETASTLDDLIGKGGGMRDADSDPLPGILFSEE
jgi:pimeloyl-ACP methyl ester carboxylesterase